MVTLAATISGTLPVCEDTFELDLLDGQYNRRSHDRHA
jgi:hypothetical protein